MHQHPELHIQLLLAQATLSDKAYGFPSVTQRAGSNTAQPGSWARWPAARGEDSLLIWLLQSSGWRRAAQDSWAHKRGDDSSQLGKLSISPWKHFSIKSGNRKRAQRTPRERGDHGSSAGPFSGLLGGPWSGLCSVQFLQPTGNEVPLYTGKIHHLEQVRVSYAKDKIYIDVNPSSSQETGLSRWKSKKKATI